MTSVHDAGAVIAALTVPLVSIEDALRPASEGGLPDAQGLYAVWIGAAALPGIESQPHPHHEGFRLLYIGIAPARVTSRQLLRSRVAGNHLRGNTAASTLRLSLAALLVDELGLQPLRRRTKVVLSSVQNESLSSWQRHNLALTWAVRPLPWEVEHDIIAALAPPLNLAGNAAHPYHSILSVARAKFRACAGSGDAP